MRSSSAKDDFAYPTTERPMSRPPARRKHPKDFRLWGIQLADACRRHQTVKSLEKSG